MRAVTTIYADHAATTKISEVAREAMTAMMENCYGNPSSLHRIGDDAQVELERCRRRMAEMLGCEEQGIIFTAGGSEADNQALVAMAARGRAEGKTHILSTAVEHPAILRPLQHLAQQGFDVELLAADQEGNITAEQVRGALRPQTALVSCIYANNEIGTILPIATIGEVCREASVPFHTDAVQAAGTIPIHMKRDSIDLISLSAHKFYGPRGAGVLACDPSLPVEPLIRGGHQEGGRRAGTENLPAIAGMTAALEECLAMQAEENRRLVALREILMEGMLSIPGAVLNGPVQDRLPGNVNISFEKVDGERLLLQLDQRGICVSSGAACAAGSVDPSHVLLAIGRSRQQAFGSLRISLGRDNTAEEVHTIIREVQEAVATQRKEGRS